MVIAIFLGLTTQTPEEWFAHIRESEWRRSVYWEPLSWLDWLAQNDIPWTAAAVSKHQDIRRIYAVMSDENAMPFLLRFPEVVVALADAETVAQLVEERE